MHVDSDVLLAKIKVDFPDAYQLCLYRCLVAQYEAENERLRAELANRDHTAMGTAALPGGYQPLDLGGGDRER